MEQTYTAAIHGRSVEHEQQSISLLDLIIVLAKHKRIVLGLPVAAGLLAAVISMLMPNVYMANAKIMPPQQNQSTAATMIGQLGALSGMAGGALGIKNPNDIYVGMLKSRTVADGLIERFKLLEVFRVSTYEAARAVLEQMTRVTSGKEGLITIEVDDKDAARAAMLTNGYVEELYRVTQTLAVTEASQRRLFFEKQLTSTRTQLANAEVALRKTQEATGLIRLEDQGKSIIESVARLQAQIAAKEVQALAMRTFATQQNPEYVLLQEELAGLRAQLSRVERDQKLGAGNVLIPTGKIPEAGLEYIRKFRDVKYYETIFELLAKQFELAKIDEARDSAVIQVLDPAIPPETKSRPHRLQIVIVSMFVTFVTAILIAFILEAVIRAKSDPQYAERLHIFMQYLRQR